MERLKTIAVTLIAANLTLYSIALLATPASAQLENAGTIYCWGYVNRTCAVRVVVAQPGG